MAKYKNKPYEIVEHEGKPARKYADGSIRNERGWPLAGVAIPGGASIITPENARDMQARAVMLKRQVMLRAQNRDVAPELIAEYGDMAAVAERAITLQQIATTPEAGKAAVMAHQALTLDTGMGEKQAIDTPQQAVTDTVNALSGLLSAITAAIQSSDNSNYRNHDAEPARIVDADIMDTGAGGESEGGV